MRSSFARLLFSSHRLKACATLWLFIVVVGGILGGVAFGSTTGVWELTSYNDFIKGKFDGVSLGRDGRLSLAPRLDTLFASEQPVVWSVIAGPNG